MCADQHNVKPPANGPDPESGEPNPTKVRSTRYDWAHDIAQAEPPEKNKPGNVAARSSVLKRVLDWLRDFLGAGRSPFDRDDDPDPMTG